MYFEKPTTNTFYISQVRNIDEFMPQITMTAKAPANQAKPEPSPTMIYDGFGSARHTNMSYTGPGYMLLEPYIRESY